MNSRLLCVINQLGSGGAERQLVTLALGFKRRGYDVHFMLYLNQDGLDQYYFDTLLAHGIGCDILPPMARWRFPLAVRRYIRQYQPDNVLAFLEGGAFLTEFASIPRRKWNVIVGERSANPRKKILKRWRFFIHFHRFADYIVANSHANIDLVKEIAPELSNEKLKVIYNALDKNLFKVDANFQFSSQQRTIVIAARHEYVKNLSRLIEAVEQLTDGERNRLKISWYGSQNKTDDSFTVNMTKLMNSRVADCFAFFQPTHDIYAIMQKADAIGLFSTYEGFPNSVCEGMMLAKPIVASAVSDVPMLVKETKNGFLCVPTDVDSIKDALRRFLHTPADELAKIGQHNRCVAEQLFDSTQILDAYEQLFR